jgi:type VI secretion system protein ImpI
MTSRNALARITLVIDNPGLLMHGCTPTHRFDGVGGTIGSRGAHWLLRDRARRVQPIHCEIRWRDGGFCVIDRCGQTYMNGSDLSLETAARVRLNPGDCLQIGDYLITAHPHVEPMDGNARHLSQQSMAELLNGSECPLHALTRPITEAPAEHASASVHSSEFDRLSAPADRHKECDPLEALIAASQAPEPEADTSPWRARTLISQDMP